MCSDRKVGKVCVWVFIYFEKYPSPANIAVLDKHQLMVFLTSSQLEVYLQRDLEVRLENICVQDLFYIFLLIRIKNKRNVNNFSIDKTG